MALDATVQTAMQEKEPVTQGGPVRWLVGATAGALGRMHLLLKDLRPDAVRRRVHKRRKRRARMQRKRADQPKGERRAKAPKPMRPAKPPKAERAKERVKQRAE
jgi:hypothetical protein